MNTERGRIYWQGLLAGLIGYATVAIALAIANVVLGKSPFHTAALLGNAIFYGLTDPSQSRVWAGPVLAYNGLHLLVFLGIGLVAAWLAHLSERGPHFWYIGAVLMLFLAFHILGAFLLIDERVRPALSPWEILAAGFVAMCTMTVYLVAVHPRLRSELGDFAALDPDLEVPEQPIRPR
jgi:hypothetical protein